MAEEAQLPQSPVFTRRRLFGAAAATGGAAMAAMALPSNVQKALASPPPSMHPSLGDIEHVVLLMMENRSFDHYCRTSGYPGRIHDPDLPGRHQRGRASARGRVPCRLHHRLTVDSRRMGMQRNVRSHLATPVPGEGDRRGMLEHQRLAQADLRRPHLGLPLRRQARRPAGDARHHRQPVPGPVRGGHPARTRGTDHGPSAPGSGPRAQASRPTWYSWLELLNRQKDQPLLSTIY
jgi:hypothetical protein